ncbi:MAG: hypothetical protein MUF15_07825, partial [Acidobacteria bacterium]|nr:hypothetical protein [Acidobacteriota bacterium]
MTPCESFETLLASRIKISIEKLSGLHETEIKILIGKYLREIRRKFPNKQVQQSFFDKVKTGNPLYILVALEELRVFGQFEKLSYRIDKLPENVTALFDQVLERIESDFNPALVRDFMIFVACGRQGMTAQELQILLSTHAPCTDSEFKPEKLPDMVWARLYRAFSTYLFERSGVIDFFHNQFCKAVENRYLKEEQVRSEAHRQLADFFYNKVDPKWDSTWDGNYPRSLSGLSYHLYHFAVLSGEQQRLLKLVDDWSFKRKQFEHFGTPELLIIDIEYALDLAVRKCDPVLLVQYALMRSRLSHTLFRSYLYRLVLLAKDKQELAHEVIKLLTDLPHRRIGLVLLAWIYRNDDIPKNFVKDILSEALNIGTPISICQIPVMLEMVLGLYKSGFKEAKGIIAMIPHCPLRQAYQTAWENTPGLAAELSSQFSIEQTHQFIASPVEKEEFIRIEEFVRRSLKNLKTLSHWESFENQMADNFGTDAVPGIYFLLAAEKMQSGMNHMAESLINRGIYFSSAVPKHYIRSLSALVEAFGKAGERDMAEEHAERVRTYAKIL